jgi:hypothetical protein
LTTHLVLPLVVAFRRSEQGAVSVVAAGWHLSEECSFD